MITLKLTAPSATICLAHCLNLGVYRQVAVVAPSAIILEERAVAGPTGLLATLEQMDVPHSWNRGSRLIRTVSGRIALVTSMEVADLRGTHLDAVWLVSRAMLEDELVSDILPQIRGGQFPTLIATY